MGAQAKIINMLLYDGTLDGVIRIEDSNWNAGELFSAPRDSISGLLKTGACNKYGVYLLLSADMVYVGQSSDLAKRLAQHVAGKDWWESVVILTTKDDSLNHSDIDFLENVLIEKAFSTKRLDCDNRKSGNPPKVDIFREVFLNQYLNEALFLMQLIGIRVFSDQQKQNRKTRKKKDKLPALNIVSMEEPAIMQLDKIPALPDPSLKIGAFIYTAMRNLESAGYAFSSEEIEKMCSPEWSKVVFHTQKPFMKKYVPGVTDNKGSDGYVRFLSDPYVFGNQKVLISKEWYERQRQLFVNWYTALKGNSKGDK